MENEELKFLLKEISVSLYTELSGEDKQYLGNDLNSILKNDPLSNLKNLSDLYDSLSDCKNSIQQVDFYDDFSENQGYQKALQKLDKEIRNHIKHELQMKVYIDSIEEKILKAQSQCSIAMESKKAGLEKLKIDNKQLKIRIVAKNDEINEIKTSGSNYDEKELILIRQKLQKDTERISELEQNIQRLKQKWSQAKMELNNKNKEYEQHKNNFISLKKITGNVEHKNSVSRLERNEKNGKDSFDILLKGKRLAKTPTKIDRSISPIPLTHQQKTLHSSKTTQSTKKLDKSPLGKILQSDLSKYKSKSRLPIYINQKK